MVGNVDTFSVPTQKIKPRYTGLHLHPRIVLNFEIPSNRCIQLTIDVAEFFLNMSLHNFAAEAGLLGSALPKCKNLVQHGHFLPAKLPLGFT